MSLSKRSPKKLYINNKKYEKMLKSSTIECFKDSNIDIEPNKISMIMVSVKDNEPACYLLAEPLIDECMIWAVCTGLKYRSQGCIKTLFKKLFKYFHRYRKFSLYVYKSNKVVIKIYKKMGFKIVGEYMGNAWKMSLIN